MERYWWGYRGDTWRNIGWKMEAWACEKNRKGEGGSQYVMKRIRCSIPRDFTYLIAGNSPSGM
ncbi:hypothetical protein ACQRBN_17305 [Bariatricus sp. SGI.154]|uniref:hypothetical protein n=1 Tax=Bariatricus sp. SGI.154 TaxID=3420549 RepID=UPI003D00B7F6